MSNALRQQVIKTSALTYVVKTKNAKVYRFISEYFEK